VASFYSPSVKEHILGLKGGETFDEDVVKALDRANGVSHTDLPQQPVSIPSFPSQRPSPLLSATNLATSSLEDPVTKNVLSA